MFGNQRELQILLKLRDQASRELQGVQREVDRLEGTFSRVGDAALRFGKLLGAAAATAISGFGFLALRAAADMEQTRIAFETMLGSAEDADRFVRDLVDFAKKTPFELQGLEEASKKLLAYGFTQDEVLPNLRALGDIASGVGMDKLPNLILAFGQVRAAGKLTGMELRQFTEAGVPLLEELAKVTGMAVEDMAGNIGNLDIPFKQVQQALMNLTDEGGRFHNLMERQSQSLSGMVSNLSDAWNNFLRNEGAKLIEWAKSFVAFAINIVENHLPRWINAISSVRATVAGLLRTLDEQTGLVTLFRDVWANLVFMYQERLRPALLELWETLRPLKPFLEAMAIVIGATLVGAVTLAIVILGAFAAGLIEVFTWATRFVNFIVGPFVRAWDTITDAIAGTVDWAEALIKALREILSLFSKVASLTSGGGILASAGKLLGKVLKVNDAIIAPNGNVITTHPDDYLIATKNPGSLAGGISITITGNTFMSDEDAAEKIGDMLISKLGLNRKFS